MNTSTKIINCSELQNVKTNLNNNNTSFAISNNNDSVTKDLSNNILLFNKSYITTPDRQIIKENVKLSFMDSIIFRVLKTKKKGKVVRNVYKYGKKVTKHRIYNESLNTFKSDSAFINSVK